MKKTRRIHEKPTRFFPSNLGLSGPAREIAKAQLCVGKSISLLFNALIQEHYTSKEAIDTIVERFEISERRARSLMKIFGGYQSPLNPNHIVFEYYFLFTVGMKKLYLFLPVLGAYYNDHSGAIKSRVALTSKSIEVYVQVSEDQYGWMYLAELEDSEISQFTKEILEPNGTIPKTPPPSPTSQSEPSAPKMAGNADFDEELCRSVFGNTDNFFWSTDNSDHISHEPGYHPNGDINWGVVI